MSETIPGEQVIHPQAPLAAWWTWSIGTALTALCLVLLVPLLVLLLLGVQAEEQRIQGHAESTTMSLAQIAAHSLERDLGETQQFIATLAARASVRALDAARCDPVFGDFQKSHPGFTALTTTWLDGKLVCSSLGAAADRPQLHTSLLASQVSGAPRFQLGRAQKGFITGRWVLPISQAVLDHGGHTRGVIAAWFDLARLSPINESTLSRLPKGTISTVFDDNGVVLARSHEAGQWVGQDRSGFPQASQALKLRLGFFQANSKTDNIHRLHAVVPVEGTPWVVSVGIPTQAMQAELAQARRQGYALFVLALLFSAVLMWLVRRYAARPLQLGAAVTQAVKGGEFQRRISPEAMGPVREFRSIAAQFNAMLDALAADRATLAQREADFRTQFAERQLAEVALGRERAMLRRVIDTIPDLIFFKDDGGYYLGCNKAFELFVGRSEKAQVGKTDFDFFDPKTASSFRAQDQHMLQSGETCQNEEWVTYPDGRQALLNTVKTPFANVQGTAIGVLGISRDITAQHQAQLALLARDETYRAILANQLDGFWIADMQGMLLEANAAYVQMSGYTREELLGMHISDLDAEDAMEVVAQRIQRIKSEGGCTFETRHRRKSGECWHAEISANFWPAQERQFVFIRDITQRKQVEIQLHQAAAVFDNTQEGMMVTDTQDIIVRINPAFTALTGYTAEDAIGQKPALLNSPHQDESLFVSMKKSLRQRGHWKGEIINRKKNGEDFQQWMTVSSILDTGGHLSHFVSTFTDISELKEAQARIHTLAFFDPLTQLPNRRLLLDRLHRAVVASGRRKTCGAVLLIDMDNFKLLNDTKGHEVGDQLLVEVARRLRNCVRDQDSLAHQGGDEFIIILEDLGPEIQEAANRAELVAEKILQTLRETYLLGAIEHHSQASIGVATFQSASDGAEEILKRADTAMYRAKADGRNTVRFFDPAMQAALEQRIRLESELRHALANQELRLFYQAQVSSGGKVVSAEALIRWEHPQRGLVSPVQFIPMAEESDLILPSVPGCLKRLARNSRCGRNTPTPAI